MISVCIATFNGKKNILEQVYSILKQIPLNSEVLISDDGSTDNTIDLINSINDSRVHLFNFNQKNVIKNFEFLISQTKGEFIFLSDQDDVWTVNKFSIFIEHFEMGYDILLSNCYVIDDDFQILHESYFQFNNSKTGFFKNIYRNSYMGCCMAFRSKVKNKILPFPKSIPMHDWWIGLIGELFYKTFFINSQLLFYRKHLDNISNTSTGVSKYSFFKKVYFRFILIFQLIKKFILNSK